MLVEFNGTEMQCGQQKKIYSRMHTGHIQNKTQSIKLLDFLALNTGMMVYPGLLFIMRGKAYWDRPDVFMPERFLNKEMQMTPEKGWFPFSIGNRQVLLPR